MARTELFQAWCALPAHPTQGSVQSLMREPSEQKTIPAAPADNQSVMPKALPHLPGE